jgi:hypothetical protein
MKTFPTSLQSRLLRVLPFLILGLTFIGTSALAVDPNPDHKTLVFPSLIPKSGHSTNPPAAYQSATIRNAYENTFEPYWKETSYFDYNLNTGVKTQGFYVDTKTYGYSYAPWPLNDRNGRPAPFFGYTGNLFFRGLIPETAGANTVVPGELPYLSGGSAATLADGVWTPGEAFEDINGDREWNPAIPGAVADDFWNVNNDNRFRQNSCGDFLPVRLDGANGSDWSGTRGEFYADYDNGTVVDGAGNVVNVDFDTSVVIYIANVVGQINDPITINELDITPYSCPDSNEGDFEHTAVDNGELPTITDIGLNDRFDYTVDINFAPRVVAATVVNGGGNAVVTYQSYVYEDDGSPYTGVTPPPTGEGERLVELVTVEVQIYQTSELYNQQLAANATLGIFGDPDGNPGEADPNNDEDGTWTPEDLGTPAEPFADFISWWDPIEEGYTYIAGGYVPVLNNHPAHTVPISFTEYQDYIRWNYPGDAEALLAHALNGLYEGAERFDVNAGTSQLRQSGFLPGLITTDPSFQWDPRAYASWTAWWQAYFGSTAPAWVFTIPALSVHQSQILPAAGAAQPWIPISGTWGYNAPREFADIPSSMYYLNGGSPAGALTSDGVSSWGIMGGDGSLGESTSPFSDSIFGQDLGAPIPSYPLNNTGPDGSIPSGGPFNYNVHGTSGYDAGNMLNFEMLTRWYTPPAALSGLDQASMLAANPHPSELKDVNLDGMVDHGALNTVEPNYATGRQQVPQVDGNVNTAFPPFNNARFVQGMIAAWDQAENFDSFRQPNSPNAILPVYFYPIYPPAPGPGAASLGGPSGQNVAVLTRDSLIPVGSPFIPGTGSGNLQVRPMSGGTIGGGGGLQVGGGSFGIGLLLHEQGHDLLGWPDLYDYDVWTGGGEELNNPIGGYDLMAGSMVHGIPDMKVSAGWIAPRNLQTILTEDAAPQTLELHPITRENDQYYYFRNPNNPNEYFYIWYTDNLTNFPVVGGPGIYISHSDIFSNSAGLPNQQRQNNHFIYEMIQADGLNELQDGVNDGNAGDPFPGSTGRKYFTANTIPSARWWDQSDSGLRILDIEIPTNPQLPATVTFQWVDPVSSLAPRGGDDTDGDGIPDPWEYFFFADLVTANETSDYRNDGITDLEAYVRNLNPTHNNTPSLFEIDTPSGLTYQEIYDDMDFLPNSWEVNYLPQLDTERFDAFADPDQDGWNNLEEYLGGSSPTSFSAVPLPVVDVRIDWAGAVSGTTIRWIAWDKPEMDGTPKAEGVVTPGIGNSQMVLDSGALPSGNAYILFYADLDSSGTWNNDTDGMPEPAGFPENMPIVLGAGNTTGLRVGLEVEPVGYRRFHWEAVPGRSSYKVTMRRLTSSGVVVFYERTIKNRTYVHEWDFKYGSPTKTNKTAFPNMSFELPHAESLKPGYEIYVTNDATNSTLLVPINAPTGSSTILWIKDWTAETLAKPSLVSPIGILGTVGKKFTWSLSSGTPTRYTLEVRKGSTTGSLVLTKEFAAPVANVDGTFSYDPKMNLGETPFENGSYFWRVVAKQPTNNGLTSQASDYGSFYIDTTEQTNGPYTVSGDLVYLGRADTGTPNFIIQAFTSTSIFSTPFHQTSVSAAGQWTLNGFPAGTYYFKAFLDVNASGTHEIWEPMGLLKTPNPYADAYSLKAIVVGPGSKGNTIAVFDVDTDNDEFSDAWEMQNFGNLSTINAGNTTATYSQHSTQLGSAFGNSLPMDASLNTDGDASPDWVEMLYGTNPNVFDVFVAPPRLLTISSDMTNNWFELSLTELSTLNYQIGLVVEYSVDVFFTTPIEVPGTRTDIQGSGPWYVTPGGTSTGFYRVNAFPIAP